MVKKLSNEQLFQALKRARLDPGPVTELSRKFYEKKLNNYYKSGQPSAYAMSVIRASQESPRNRARYTHFQPAAHVPSSENQQIEVCF